MEVISENPITAFQIVLQMVHRLVALAIFILVAVCAWLAQKPGAPASWPASQMPDADFRWQDAGAPGDGLPIHRRLSLFWLGLIVVQIILGAATIWSNKAADVATAHVLVGALTLVTGALWCIIAFGPDIAAFCERRTSGQRSPAAVAAGAHPAMVGNK
jgi:cytochrome c oxidase assembly protein subunit 15